MKKELKDYLHLYIGCELIGEYNDEPNKGILTGIHGEYQAEIQFYEPDGINVFEEPHYNEFVKVKPLLRPLPSMTADEAVEAYNAAYPSEEDFSRGLKVLWISGTHRDGYTPELIRHLLSKHFDLFGLIDAGLAMPLQPALKADQ